MKGKYKQVFTVYHDENISIFKYWLKYLFWGKVTLIISECDYIANPDYPKHTSKYLDLIIEVRII